MRADTPSPTCPDREWKRQKREDREEMDRAELARSNPGDPKRGDRHHEHCADPGPADAAMDARSFAQEEDRASKPQSSESAGNVQLHECRRSQEWCETHREGYADGEGPFVPSPLCALRRSFIKRSNSSRSRARRSRSRYSENSRSAWTSLRRSSSSRASSALRQSSKALLPVARIAEPRLCHEPDQLPHHACEPLQLCDFAATLSRA